MQTPALLQTSDDITTIAHLTNQQQHKQQQKINNNNDDTPSLSMHENVTASNSPNNQQHIFKHYEKNFNQNNNNNNNNNNDNNRLTNYYTSSNISSTSITSPSFSTYILNSISNSYHHNQQQHIYIPTLSSSFNVLPPILTKEIISTQAIQSNHLDPYVDDFEIVRTKVTDITRTMQRFHVSELEDNITILPSSASSTSIVNQLDVRSPITLNGPLSPLSILCPTTNSLIQKRVLEETGSYCDDDEEEDEDDIETLAWRNQFLHLMSDIITYSENLELISTELLKTEGKVRELVLLQKSILEDLEEKEKMYKDKINECEQVSQQQLGFIQSLIELDQDLDISTTTTLAQASHSSNKKQNRRSTITNNTTTSTTLSTIYRRQSSEHSQGRGILNKSCSASSFTTVDSRFLQPDHQDNNYSNHSIQPIHIMEDIVHKLRWEVGSRIGGGVGTGHVIHSFEGPLNGIELIIAGSGTIATLENNNRNYDDGDHDDDDNEVEVEEREQQQSYTQSSSIQHIRFHRHHYMLHINHHDRKTRFKLLPKYLWTPDEQVNQCQFKTLENECSTKFNFFQRRHHCRRCGIIICQRHGLNRLPLFSASSLNSNADKWYRVCDTCFHDLIIVTKKKKK